jgi:hypothetical protein
LHETVKISTTLADAQLAALVVQINLHPSRIFWEVVQVAAMNRVKRSRVVEVKSIAIGDWRTDFFEFEANAAQAAGGKLREYSRSMSCKT